MARPDLMDVEAEANRMTLALACLARMNWCAAPGDAVDLEREELGALFEVLKTQSAATEALLAALPRHAAPVAESG